MDKEKYFIIGDIHGCYDEFVDLISYNTDNRHVISVGDIIDRGPDSAECLYWFLMNTDKASFVIGNHEDKLIRYLNGNNVKVSKDLAITIDQINNHHSSEFIKEQLTTNYFDYYKLLDDERLYIVHASLYISEHTLSINGETKNHVSRNKALYGYTTGAKDELGYPVRLDWAQGYTGPSCVVHGHVPVSEVLPQNNVWNIDTSCVFGNKLTALKYPEMEIIQVNAKRTYSERKTICNNHKLTDATQ